MILDKLLIFSAAQVLTATADSTNIIDLAAFGDADGGKDLNLVVSTGVGATSAGAATLTVTLQTCATVGGSYETLYSSPAFTLAQSAANKNLIQIMLPRGKKRFLKLVYTVGTADWTAGTINAELVFDVDTASNSQYKA